MEQDEQDRIAAALLERATPSVGSIIRVDRARMFDERPVVMRTEARDGTVWALVEFRDGERWWATRRAQVDNWSLEQP